MRIAVNGDHRRKPKEQEYSILFFYMRKGCNYQQNRICPLVTIKKDRSLEFNFVIKQFRTEIMSNLKQRIFFVYVFPFY